MKSGILRSPFFFLLLAAVLFFPAFMINLGDEPIGEDEAIRALVAFEMHKSGDYISPTIGGTDYLKKPPLYNWLIAGSYTLFGNYSEMAVRFPMILSLLFFSATIFFIVRRELGTKLAVLNALIYLTLGRIIIYESLMGLIDITFSWLTYLAFMVGYILFKKEKFLLLFMAVYFITAITWLMKGLPGIVFLGITLLVLFISGRRFKLLLNWRHLAGIIIFLIIVGGYYIIYFSVNKDISVETMFSTLFDQSMRRTAVRFGLLSTVIHLFSFPLEMLYHFLPWTILTLGLFATGGLKKIWAQPFLRYNLLILVFNIIPYWTSPEVYPRYILMLPPLYFVAVSWLYFELKAQRHMMAKLIEYIFGASLILLSIAPWAANYVEMVRDVDHVLIISITLSIVVAMLTFIYWRSNIYRLFWFAIALMVLRIGFDALILPTRQHNSDSAISKELACALAEKTEGKQLYSYWDKDNKGQFFWYMRNCVSFRYHFHLSVARDEIIYHNSEQDPDALYFGLPSHIKNDSVEVLDMLERKHSNREPIPLFRFKRESKD